MDSVILPLIPRHRITLPVYRLEMFWYNAGSKPRACAFAGCTTPPTPRTEFCKRHGALQRVTKHRAIVRLTAEIEDSPDRETIAERRHWYHLASNPFAGVERVDDPDVAWCLQDDARRRRTG